MPSRRWLHSKQLDTSHVLQMFWLIQVAGGGKLQIQGKTLGDSESILTQCHRLPARTLRSRDESLSEPSIPLIRSRFRDFFRWTVLDSIRQY